MSRSLVLGNGSMLVGLDLFGQVRDLYFPHVGLENHVGGHYAHRVGVWTEDQLHWLDDGSWHVSINCGAETLSGRIKAVNDRLRVQLDFEDVVYNEKNIFLRRVTVRNLADRARTLKLFFHHQFEIYESHRGDTGYFDPLRNAVIHYKGHRVFLVNTLYAGAHFDDYSIGIFNIEGKEGTHKDAEDGQLAKSPIEHGPVDSVLGVTISLASQASATAHYWLAAGMYIPEVLDLNGYILSKTPDHLIQTTQDFWRAWTNRQNFTFYGLDEKLVHLFKKSLVLVRTHVDNNGGVIASSDFDMLQHGRDTYSYVWPRDGALTAIALDKAGDSNVARKFFEFCNDVVRAEGYFMHKYLPDKALGSSWHPWVRNGKPELPIQEDETALVIYALWRHYELTRDLEFIESVYNSLIKKCCNFMVSYRDKLTGLPRSSYDLWEEKYGVFTFTCASVYAALTAGAAFAGILGKTVDSQRFAAAGAEVKQGILQYLYNDKDRMFYKAVTFQNGVPVYDAVLDASSIYGIFAFGVLEAQDARVRDSIATVEARLCIKTPVGGVPRYENDMYYRTGLDVPPNPWIITTLWLAQYYIAIAQSEVDMTIVKQWLSWAEKYALPSGVLPEQLQPHTGEHLSATPLTWSHSEYIVTVIKYLEKLEELGICRACNPVNKYKL